MVKASYPCLWFDGNAQQAAEFYCSVFENSSITATNPFVVKFLLNGVEMMGLNGGPQHTFSEAVSFVIECDTQAEIDHYWEKLSAGGREKMCGWLEDQFGLSWQVVPKVLGELMSNPDNAQKVFAVFQQMKKFEIAPLLEAVK
ncbi:hypothetical protein DBR32_08665 [Taibaiella sp. KBW10]|uniref:VOC family protein n=1 Tax=Taibaiella sp. KBW10 TaxID=2153357 RepID=UPI000F5A888B|nr:VOC family protein [Taibaiella sp. KBW10]RQO30785.1 hypothetical protein DBR32_08665 [Taibaiella sp. KBW10]